MDCLINSLQMHIFDVVDKKLHVATNLEDNSQLSHSITICALQAVLLFMYMLAVF